jgi:hypothetical protein
MTDPGRAVASARDGDVDRSIDLWGNPPEDSGAAIAEQRTPSASEHSGHVAASIGELRVTRRIDAGVHRLEAARSHPALDSSPAEIERQKLSPGDNAMLPCSETRDRVIRAVGSG